MNTIHGWTSDAAERHQIVSSRWAVLDSWTRLLAALSASLSALTLFADNKTTTAVFAITAAVTASLNAAWAPADRAERHRRSYKEFVGLLRPLVDLEFILRDRVDTHYSQKTGQFYQRGMTHAELCSAWQDFRTFNDALDVALRNAPVMNRLVGGDGTPRTSWGMERLRKRLARRREVKELYLQDWLAEQGRRRDLDHSAEPDGRVQKEERREHGASVRELQVAESSSREEQPVVTDDDNVMPQHSFRVLDKRVNAG